MPGSRGRIALVTGGASGLGRAIARRLARDGATVCISDRQVDVGVQVAAEDGFTFLAHDVTDEARWRDVVDEVQARMGGMHILVNNAGILGAVERLSPVNTRLDDWKQVFAVNVEGVFLGCKAAIPAIAASGGGSIVNISSAAAMAATPHATAYGASKAAVRQLTKSVAQHCALEGLPIRCNSVHPGTVETPLSQQHVAEAARVRGVSPERVVAETAMTAPIGGINEPADVAAAVAFLVSDDARRITGDEILVDGGLVNCSTYHLLRRRQAF